MRRWWPAVALLLAACAGVAEPPPQGARSGRPAARIVILGDLDGTIEPCGCRSRPLGGADRIVTKVKALAREVPTVVVAVGDTFFADPVPEPDTLPQKRIEAHALAGVLGGLGARVTPARGDLGDGLAALRTAIEGTGIRFLASNVSPRATFADGQAVRVGPLSIGLVGVVHFSHREGAPPVDGVVVQEPIEPTARAVQRLHRDGSDFVVALSSMGRRASRGLVRRVPGIDLVAVGDADEYPAPDPDTLGGATLVVSGHKGQGIAVVDLFPRGDDRNWQDASRGAALDARVARIGRRIADLEARLPQANAAQKRDLDRRIASLRAERRTAAEGRPPSDRSYLTVRAVEIGPDIPRDPETKALLERTAIAVAEANSRALADEAPPPVPPGAAGYVGGRACVPCHAEDDRVWRTTPHARAIATLAAEHKEHHLDCVSCHVTGYRQPGGSTAVRYETLADVQCEACHGPGSLHVATRGLERPFAVRRDAPPEVCVQCHNPEHSDRFVYDTYRPRILGPGHGG